jgi:hypothetical protein
MYLSFWVVWAARQGNNEIVFNFAFDGFFHVLSSAKQIQNVLSKGQLTSE